MPFSIIFALVSFSYNIWRLQKSEGNNTIRMASFEVLTELSQFEQILYASHYDKNIIEENPRKALVKIGLIKDLSILISKPVEQKVLHLKNTWNDNWQNIDSDNAAVETLVKELDIIRVEIRNTLETLD
ncbi:MAG: hypothetical protein COA44_05910 [Arcobacter sp.]|nr:MAG: hypothetical protein COA44_05910 [Arcobacter sp.]